MTTIDIRKLGLVLIVLMALVVLPVMAVSETFYPVDAAIMMHNPSGNASFYDIRNGAGTSVDRTYGDVYALYYDTQSGDAATGWDWAQHWGVIFNTSSLDDTAVITSAYIAVWETGGSSYLGTQALGFTGGKTDNGNVSFALGDYNSWSEPVLTNYIAVSTGTDAWKNHTLTTDGKLYINKSGNTTFYGFSSQDVTNTSFTWVTDTYTRARMYIGTGSGSSYPMLVITYYIPSLPVSAFSANVTTGTVPLNVGFTDATENVPTSWNWSFGDGNYSEIQNATHQYASTGTYTVILNATNSLGSDLETKTGYITVNPPAPTAAFSAYPLLGASPLYVHFTDASTGTPTSWLWDYGDGGTDNNTLQNPYHTYTANGYYTVNLTSTNAYGTDYERKLNYIVAADAVYGDHPYLFFNNITNLDGFTYRNVSPWSGWYSDIYNHRNDGIATSPKKAIWYHLCSNTGGTGCSAYANSTISELQTISNTSSTSSLSTQYYAISYDLIAGTKDTGSTTLTTTIDNDIRDRLAKIADGGYQVLMYDRDAVNFVDLKARVYPTIWLLGEVLHDYDNTGKGLTSGASDWIKIGTDEFFVSSTVTNQAPDPGGFAFYQINKTGGKQQSVGYTSYYYSFWQPIVPVYSRIHGNVFEAHPGFKAYYMQWLYATPPSTYQDGYLDPGGWDSYPWLTAPGLSYLSEKERSWLRWLNKNTTEMVNVPIEKNEGHIYYPQSWLLFLSYGDYTNESVYRPTHKNWITPTYTVMRTGWSETSNWISISAGRLLTDSNAIDYHPDLLAIQLFSHGDATLLDGGQVRYLSSQGQARALSVMHNVLMVSDPRGTIPQVGFTGWGSNITTTGAFAPKIGQTAAFTKFIDSQSMGYIKGYSYISSLNTGEKSYIGITPIGWTREIISPQGEYFVVIDRANSAVTWNYKQHWNLGSITGYNRSSAMTIDAMQNTRVKGDLYIGGTDYQWGTRPFAIEENTSIKTNEVIWNTTNWRGADISLKLFSAPSSYVNFYKFVSKVGGYGTNGVANHEYTNPHFFFTEPENTASYRVTALLSSWATDTNLLTPSELAVTGTGSSIRINASTGTQKDYFYTGLGVSNFSTFQTDADTVYVRKSDDTTIQSYLIVNGTYLYDGSKVFESTTKLDYISVNKTTLGNGGKFNVSGSGATVLSFYNVPTVNNMTKDNSSFATWSMSGSTLNVTTTLSDHYFEFGTALEGYPDEGPGEFMYNETSSDTSESTDTFSAETGADGDLTIYNISGDTFTNLRNGAGTAVDLDGYLATYRISPFLGSHTTTDNYTTLLRDGWSADTSSIPDNAEITSASFTIFGALKAQGLGQIGITITDFEPTDPALLVASDFSKTKDLIYTNNISYSDFATGDWNTFYFTNLSAINKGGYTSLMVRLLQDVDNSSTGITWDSGKNTYLAFYDTSQSVNIPLLRVVYTIPETAAPVAAIIANPELGEAPLNVSFYGDSTGGNATSWNWSFGEGNYSTSQDTEWTYATVGNYTVSLFVENEIGNDTATQDIVVITADTSGFAPTAHFYMNITASGGAPIADFTMSNSTIVYGDPIWFNDTSINTPTSWNWTIHHRMDSPPAYDYYYTRNVSYTNFWGYTTSAHEVMLTVTNDHGSDTITKNFYVFNNATPTPTPTPTPTTTIPPAGSTLYLDDYGLIADGRDEHALLQSAFDYATTNSKTYIVFPEDGTIGLDDYVETPENTELIGNNCTIKLIDSASMSHDQGFFYLRPGSYAHDFIFDGNMDNQGGSATNGIMVYEDAEFANNVVKNVGAYTVFTYLSDNAYIHNNTVYNSWQYGISTGGTTTPYELGIRIENNTISDCEEVGIKIKGADGAIIANNVITMPTLLSYPGEEGDPASPIGIHLYSADEPNRNIIIRNNTVTGVAGASYNIGVGSSSSLNPNSTVIFNTLTTVQNGVVANFNTGNVSYNTITYESSCISGSGSGYDETGNSCTAV